MAFDWLINLITGIDEEEEANKFMSGLSEDMGTLVEQAGINFETRTNYGTLRDQTQQTLDNLHTRIQDMNKSAEKVVSSARNAVAASGQLVRGTQGTTGTRSSFDISENITNISSTEGDIEGSIGRLGEGLATSLNDAFAAFDKAVGSGGKTIDNALKQDFIGTTEEVAAKAEITQAEEEVTRIQGEISAARRSFEATKGIKAARVRKKQGEIDKAQENIGFWEGVKTKIAALSREKEGKVTDLRAQMNTAQSTQDRVRLQKLLSEAISDLEKHDRKKSEDIKEADGQIAKYQEGIENLTTEAGGLNELQADLEAFGDFDASKYTTTINNNSVTLDVAIETAREGVRTAQGAYEQAFDTYKGSLDMYSLADEGSALRGAQEALGLDTYFSTFDILKNTDVIKEENGELMVNDYQAGDSIVKDITNATYESDFFDVDSVLSGTAGSVIANYRSDIYESQARFTEQTFGLIDSSYTTMKNNAINAETMGIASLMNNQTLDLNRQANDLFKERQQINNDISGALSIAGSTVNILGTLGLI